MSAEEAVPAPFVDWRRKIRAEAQRVGLRVSVRRLDDVVLVFDAGYRPTLEQQRAIVTAVASLVTDADSARYDNTLRRSRRAHLTVVRDDD